MMKRVGMAAALWAGLLSGCDDGGGGGDDGAGGTAPAGGSAAGGSDGTGGAEAAEAATFAFSSVQLTEPSTVGPILTNVLNNSIRQKLIILMMQVEGWDSGGPLVVRGGAADLSAGADTTDDPADDVYAWLTSGECRVDADTLEPCSVDVGETSGTQDGTHFVTEPTVLNIYAPDLSIIIPIKQVILEGEIVDGLDVTATLSGVVTQADAIDIKFSLTPGAPVTDLETLLGATEPDTDLDGEPAYTFTGNFEATLVTFGE